MRRLVLFLLVAIFAAAGLMTQGTRAQEQKPTKMTTSAKRVRFRGVIVRFNESESNLEVRQGTITKTIYYDSSTEWTKRGKASEKSAFKEGSDVICVGKTDEKGNFHATRVDLRKE